MIQLFGFSVVILAKATTTEVTCRYPEENRYVSVLELGQEPEVSHKAREFVIRIGI